MITIANQASSYQKIAANQAAQCYRLQAILGYHLESLIVAENHAKNAVTFSRLADDPNLLVTSLVLHALIHHYMGRPAKGLEKCEEANLYLDQTTYAVRSYLYRTQAVCQAQLDQENEALTSLHLAYDNFFKHPASEKPFVHAAHDQFELSLWDGITRHHLGQHAIAQEILEKVNPLVPGIPERVRTGFLNNLVFAEVRMSPERRDMERSITIWTEAVKSAIDLKSELRFGEARQAYDHMLVAFPGEQRVKSLKGIIKHWDQE